MIQSPFSNGSSPTPETLGGGEARFTYVPATVGGEGIATTDGTNIAQIATSGGEDSLVVLSDKYIYPPPHPKKYPILTCFAFFCTPTFLATFFFSCFGGHQSFVILLVTNIKISVLSSVSVRYNEN